MKELKQIVLENKDKDLFEADFKINGLRYQVDIENGELMIQVWPSGKIKDLIIHDWDEEDMEEFENWDWPNGKT